MKPTPLGLLRLENPAKNEFVRLRRSCCLPIRYEPARTGLKFTGPDRPPRHGELNNRADRSVYPTICNSNHCVSVARTLLSALVRARTGVFPHARQGSVEKIHTNQIEGAIAPMPPTRKTKPTFRLGLPCGCLCSNCGEKTRTSTFPRRAKPAAAGACPWHPT
jgi:hypothetical protein